MMNDGARETLITIRCKKYAGPNCVTPKEKGRGKRGAIESNRNNIRLSIIG